MRIEANEIQIVPVSELKKSPRNRNNHPQEQIQRLAEIIKYQGFRQPIVVSGLSGHVVAGHGRLEAAKLLGMNSVPVIVQQFESEDQEYSFSVSDNAIAAWAELDLSGINTDILDMGPDFDLTMLGIKDFVLEPAEKFEAQSDEDEIPTKVEARTKLGDIYQLGRHRLMCGDSTSIDAVEKLMDGKKAEITFTSPPYNLGNNAKLRGYNGDGDETVYTENNDHKSQDEYLSFMSAWTLVALKFSTTVFCNVQLLAGNKLAIPKYWMAFHDKLIDLMVWDKEHAAPSMAARVLNSVFEMIFIFTDENEPKRSINTGRDFRGTMSNVFRLNPIRGGKDEFQKTHGAVFPVAFAEHFAEHFADHTVLDLFGGSGSTMIACEKIRRTNYSMELDPHYCDVIIARWENYTGKKAELVSG